MVNNTEKNEQQAIHYPFSGFYRKLLPTAETDTTEEQTAQVAPMPAPADDTPQNATGATERAPRWVADVIGEDYKTWGKGKVVIEFSKTDADSMQQASIKSRYNGKV